MLSVQKFACALTLCYFGLVAFGERGDMKRSSEFWSEFWRVFGVSLLGMFLSCGVCGGFVFYTNEATESSRSKSPTAMPIAAQDQFVKAVAGIDAGRTFIDQVAFRDRTAVITVSSEWHGQNYQARLQVAQDIWQIWATLASPTEPDLAYISIRDHNGNEVGGSRMWSGSLVWVSER